MSTRKKKEKEKEERGREREREREREGESKGKGKGKGRRRRRMPTLPLRRERTWPDSGIRVMRELMYETAAVVSCASISLTSST